MVFFELQFLPELQRENMKQIVTAAGEGAKAATAAYNYLQKN